MYKGKIELGGQDGQNLLNLLTAGDELMLDEFCNYIQNFLIQQKFEWLEENLVEVLRITGNCSSCTALREYYLNEDILKYHLKPGSIPRSIVLPPRDQGMNLDSLIIKPIHARLICGWIDGKNILDKSFIFSLGDGKNLQEVKLSRVRDSATSMYGHTSYGPHFGTADLRMYSPFNNKENCSCQQASYFRTVTEHVRFAVEEYEVFQVVPKQ
ncbi:32218_t:CDS:2 [Gigaspora margarita]|uniref:32218_t:CDS:1 n=1 Tax=Gigaspora margarita TaxID=4874 RepID=A0ABN7VFA2_GIGMA|nr:32218_t:CDS:2 [Gigaspora margarita]